MLSSLDDVVLEVCNALGVQVQRTTEPSGAEYDYKLRLAAFPEGKGVALFLRHGYLQWTFDLRLEDFGNQILEQMRSQAGEKGELLDSLVAHARRLATLFYFRGEGFYEDSLAPSDWTDFSFKAVFEYRREQDAYSALSEPLLAAISIPLCLLETSDEWAEPLEGDFEGRQYLAEVRKYERSRYNRAICLRNYGFSCRGCGLQMSETYGPLSNEVIDVHHIVPVSKMARPARLDPLRDLVPLCPTCHRVIHTEDPPLSVAQLREKTGFVVDDVFGAP